MKTDTLDGAEDNGFPARELTPEERTAIERAQNIARSLSRVESTGSIAPDLYAQTERKEGDYILPYQRIVDWMRNQEILNRES